MNWYLKVLEQYADFSGRARRKEFWMFVLFNIIMFIIVGFVSFFIGGQMPILIFIYAIFIVIPSIAVTVRRLHDIGQSGWMYFIRLIPIVGPIWLLVLLVQDSEPGDNQYGSNPKDGPEDYFD